MVSCLLVTEVSCGLSMLITCLLVNLPTRQLPLIIIDVNCGLLLQLTCQLVNLSTRQLPLMITEAGKIK